MTNRPWPRLYQMLSADIKALPPAERDAIYAEYRAYWAGRESHSNPTLQSEYQKDWEEDRRGDFR